MLVVQELDGRTLWVGTGHKAYLEDDDDDDDDDGDDDREVKCRLNLRNEESN